MDEAMPVELDPEPIPDDFPDHSRERRLALVLIAITLPLSAFFELISNPATRDGLELATLVVINALALTWMQFDGLERGRPIGTSTRIAAMLFGPLLVPVHLLRTRGPGRGLVAVLKALGFYLLVLLLYGIVVGVITVVRGG